MNPWTPPELRTERLLIRPFRVDDVNAVHTYAATTSAAAYGSWLGGTDPSSAARYIADTIARYGRPPRSDLCVTQEGRIVGGLGYRQIWLQPPAIELGWVIHPNALGHGIAQEALGALVGWLWSVSTRLVRMEARVADDDAGGRKVLERLGFQHEGILRFGRSPDGNALNGALYGLLRGDSTGVEE